MGDLNQDTDKLFADFLSVLGRYLAIAWNLLMKCLLSLGLMPFFKKHPKLLIVLILVLMALTPPIALFWAAIGFVALNNDVKPENNFIITETQATP